MLLSSSGEGFLIDWDTCCNLKKNIQQRRESRTGSWQFASAMILQITSGEVNQVLQDDLESFLHILTWVAVRYARNDLSGDDRVAYLKHVFDAYQPIQGKVSGGVGKRDKLMSGFWTPIGWLTDSPLVRSPLDKLLNDIAQALGVRYRPTPSDAAFQNLDLKLQTCDEGMLKLLEELPTYQYRISQDRISNHDWMIKTLREAIRADGWPVSDEAVQLDLGQASFVSEQTGQLELSKYVLLDEQRKNSKSLPRSSSLKRQADSDDVGGSAKRKKSKQLKGKR